MTAAVLVERLGCGFLVSGSFPTRGTRGGVASVVHGVAKGVSSSSNYGYPSQSLSQH